MHVAHQLIAGQRLLLTLDLQLKLQPVGEHGVDRQQRVLAVGVLEIDQLLGRFLESEGLETPQILEEMSVVACLLFRLGSRSAAASSSSCFHHRVKKSIRFWTPVRTCSIRLR